MDRTLTFAQHKRLDELADAEPLARVVGWTRAGGPLVQLQDGTMGWIARTGQLRPLPFEPQAA